MNSYGGGCQNKGGDGRAHCDEGKGLLVSNGNKSKEEDMME